MRLTMSFTTGNDDTTWFNRLPRIGSRTTSMSFRKADASESSNEKIPEGGLLSRASTKAREETTRISMEVPRRRYDGTGRPVGGVGLLAPQPPQSPKPQEQEQIETYKEGRNLIFEDEQGDVISQTKTPPRPHEHHIGPLDANAVAEKLQHAARHHKEKEPIYPTISGASDANKHKPAMAFRFDDNIIVEDADGEVIKRYKIPKAKRVAGDVEAGQPSGSKSSIFKNWFGFSGSKADDDGMDLGAITDEELDDPKVDGKRIRLRDHKGRKLSKQQFIHELSMMDPHARRAMVSQSSLFPEEESGPVRNKSAPEQETTSGGPSGTKESSAVITSVPIPSKHHDGTTADFTPTDSNEKATPYHDNSRRSEITGTLGTAMVMSGEEETSAERRRREAALGITGDDSDSDDDGGPRVFRQQKPREIRFATQERGQRQRDTPGGGSESNSSSSNEAEGPAGGGGGGGDRGNHATGTGTGTSTPGRVIQFVEDSKGKSKQW